MPLLLPLVSLLFELPLLQPHHRPSPYLFLLPARQCLPTFSIRRCRARWFQIGRRSQPWKCWFFPVMPQFGCSMDLVFKLRFHIKIMFSGANRAAVLDRQTRAGLLPIQAVEVDGQR
uniref:Uncharacterized protein n=1 Tax=Aegilops tauschii TaxID=37682 RepID=R7W3E6_AEGTA